MLSFILFIAIGAGLAGFYGHRQVAASTARNIANVRAVPIEERDAQARRTRAETTGYIKGLYLSGVMVPAVAGAAFGALAWLAWKAFVWFFG